MCSPKIYSTCVLISMLFYILDCAVTIRGTCPQFHIACNDSPSSECVDEDKWCDAKKDCPGGEDEFNCTMCTGSSIKCQNENKCIHIHQLCDGNPDCKHGVEDLGCRRCQPDQFECWDGTCIDEAAVCCGICGEQNGQGCQGVTPMNCTLYQEMFR